MKSYKFERLDNLQSLSSNIISTWKEFHKDSFYDIDRSREKMAPALADTRSYYLRIPSIERQLVKQTESTANILKFQNTKLYYHFNFLTDIIMQIGKEINGVNGWNILGRIFVTKLSKDKIIARHTDSGIYFDTLHRYHVPLDTTGCNFCWDDHKTFVDLGHLWKFNNSIPHWVENGNSDRTHLIFDAV